MTLYSYRCDQCKRLFNTEHRGDSTTCSDCGARAIRRFTFYTASGMQEHFNAAAGEYVSNRQQLNDAFKRKSAEASARTGIDHEYVMVDPADMRDPSAHGVNEDNLETTRRRQHDLLA
jgi:DNA-directed RNA polymerase subunit RPC12/RpoP